MLTEFIAIGISFLVVALSGLILFFAGSGGYQGGRNPRFAQEVLGASRVLWKDIHDWGWTTEDDMNGRVKSTLDVPDSINIKDLNVELDITMPDGSNSDLNVHLISPEGLRVKLFSDVGVLTSDFMNTILDDEAAIPITKAEGPFTGIFRPERALSKFDDSDSIWVAHPFTVDHQSLLTCVSRLRSGRLSPLTDALSFAAEYLEKNASSEDRKILLVSDGISTQGLGFHFQLWP